MLVKKYILLQIPGIGHYRPIQLKKQTNRKFGNYVPGIILCYNFTYKKYKIMELCRIKKRKTNVSTRRDTTVALSEKSICPLFFGLSSFLCPSFFSSSYLLTRQQSKHTHTLYNPVSRVYSP